MNAFTAKTGWVGFAVTFLAPLLAQGGTWTSAAVLSTGGQGWESTAAIDGNGNSTALWEEITTSESQLWSRARPAGGNWGSVMDASSALLSSVAPVPVVRTSTAGLATVVWNDSSGVWTADRPASSNWTAPRLLLSGVSNQIFVMNSQGAAAIAWTVGGPRSSSSQVMAIVRPAGGAWNSPQVVISGPHVIADHAAIGTNGAIIVTWESYSAVCTRYGCSVSNFVLQASRQNPGTASWLDSGALLGPDNGSHDARVALDAAGGAALVALNSSGAYASSTQGNTGGAWSAFKTIAAPQGIAITTDFAGDDAGQVTLLYEFVGFSTSQEFAVSGSITNNTWSSPAVISGSDMNVGQVYLAVSPGGPALAIWLNSASTVAVRAVVRSSGTGSWSAPVSLSGSGTELSPEAAAINSSGSAVVTYSAYNSSDVHTEYAANYQP